MTENKKLIFGSLLLVFILSIFFACKTTKQSTELLTKEEKGLLWKIEKPGLKQVSWLFGTIHMIPKDDFFLPEGTEEAFKSSEIVVFEVDLNDMNDPAEQMALFQKSLMKGDQSIKDLVSSEDYELIKAHFEELGLPFFMFEKVKPMFLSVMTDDSMTPEAIQNGSMKFYEFEFMAMANEQGKEIRGLEGIDFQMSMMDSIPYEDQANMLVEAIRMKEEGADQMDSLIQLYVMQDISALHASFKADSISRFDSLLLINRNHLWIPQMEEQMKEQSCFYAVGAGHLAGPDGVIRLLRKQGYVLEAVLND